MKWKISTALYYLIILGDNDQDNFDANSDDDDDGDDDGDDDDDDDDGDDDDDDDVVLLKPVSDMLHFSNDNSARLQDNK